ncbi:MAG: hypothetical protein B6D41_14685 [Chloroflexi bacterium UTCFX4]|nr:MAG: hypothetical protein B6D41_14685 [Chloroflexi bacterium UTCFX4]
MPSIFREKGYRFYFYEADLDEPIHVHVAKSGRHAKIWVQPIRVAIVGGFKRHELSEIQRITRRRSSEINAAWRDEQNKRQSRSGKDRN